MRRFWRRVRPASFATSVFTGHKDPRIHLYALEAAARHGFKFDAVQMPLNVMDAHFRSFSKLVLPELVKHNIGVLAMKTLANGPHPEIKHRYGNGMYTLCVESADIGCHCGY